MVQKWLTRILSVVALSVLVVGMTGCSKESYPADKIREDLLEICQKEYGITELDVEIVDNTIGVYLPLKKLFATDFKEAVASGKVSNVENLFEPSAEALDKVEDVLFSISRVILSTDRPLDFYVLQATDIESTGLQLVLKGYVNDIKRVRIWDIPRSEYRKRVIHELRLNQAVIWHKPVRQFFEDLPKLSFEKLGEDYFEETLPADTIKNIFLDVFPDVDGVLDISHWDIMDIRSTELSHRSAVVYTKVAPKGKVEELTSDKRELEYLFIVTMKRGEGKISRVIPFQFQNQDGTFEKIDFPPELQIGESLSSWKKEFYVEPILLGGFLAQQLTRRVQGVLAEDERIRNTVREAKLEFGYSEDPNQEASHFTLNADVRLRDFDSYRVESFVMNEDISYLLGLASREFVNVLRGYSFGDYDYLELNITQDSNPRILGREDLELFRRNKINIKTLLTSLL